MIGEFMVSKLSAQSEQNVYLGSVNYVKFPPMTPAERIYPDLKQIPQTSKAAAVVIELLETTCHYRTNNDRCMDIIFKYIRDNGMEIPLNTVISECSDPFISTIGTYRKLCIAKARANERV
jgi:hypothetical protein